MYCGGQTDAAVCAPLPRGAAGIRRRRHRGVARAPPARCSRARRSGSHRRTGRRRCWRATFPDCDARRDRARDVPTHRARGPARRAAMAAITLPDDACPTVAVLGAIGPDKGARRLERLVELARARGAPIRFVLIGYMDVQHGPWQSRRRRVHRARPLRAGRPARPARRTIASRSCCIRRQVRRRSATRCRKRGLPGGPVLVPPIGALARARARHRRGLGADGGRVARRGAHARPPDALLDPANARCLARGVARCARACRTRRCRR